MVDTDEIKGGFNRKGAETGLDRLDKILAHLMQTQLWMEAENDADLRQTKMMLISWLMALH